MTHGIFALFLPYQLLTQHSTGLYLLDLQSLLRHCIYFVTYEFLCLQGIFSISRRILRDCIGCCNPGVCQTVFYFLNEPYIFALGVHGSIDRSTSGSWPHYLSPLMGPVPPDPIFLGDDQNRRRTGYIEWLYAIVCLLNTGNFAVESRFFRRILEAVLLCMPLLGNQTKYRNKLNKKSRNKYKRSLKHNSN